MLHCVYRPGLHHRLTHLKRLALAFGETGLSGAGKKLIGETNIIDKHHQTYRC